MALLDSNVGHADLTFHNRTSHMVVLGDSRSLAFDRTLTLAVRMLRTLGSVFKHSGKRKQKSIQFAFSPLIIKKYGRRGFSTAAAVFVSDGFIFSTF